MLGDVKTIADILASATAVALVVGGLWAYFRFVKGRTYRPRLEVAISGQWREPNGRVMLQARITVRNIGSSVVTLLQRGTGLRVSVIAADQERVPTAIAWRSLRVFEVFTDHQWIEPGETIVDDLLLDLGLARPETVRFDARLVWQWSGRQSKVVVVTARHVLPIEPILVRSIDACTDRPVATEGDSDE